MRLSSRYLATGLAVVVWLFAGYAVASRSLAQKAIAPAAFDAAAAVQSNTGLR